MSTPRVAIVTGAARGIGKAIALRLAHDGLDVVVNDIPSKAKELEALVTEICAKNRKSLAVVGDVSQETDVQRLVDTAVTELGGLDVVRYFPLSCLVIRICNSCPLADDCKCWHLSDDSSHLQ
jgi:NAD(P)-dependent dehydrogenase (short-subunit alcohol dehydrogenase family)